jgi:NDP-sugar pyrophosphorylase family protein
VPTDLGVIETDGQDRVTGYVEKPTLEFEASTGIYFFEPSVLDHIPPGERMDLPDLIVKLIASGATVGRYAFRGHWLDIGRHADYAEAISLFEAQKSAFLPDED